MGNTTSIKKIGFEDMKYVIKNKKKSYVMINTLAITEQECLIPGTVSIKDEEAFINRHLNKNISIIIYGKNANDDSIFKKYEQLLKLGFNSVFVYTGGIFEWLLLQDIYGVENFPTTTRQLDHLKYRARSAFNYLLENGDID